MIKMKIFLAGSTGQVATEVLKLLSAQGKKVIAGARRPAAVEKLHMWRPLNWIYMHLWIS